MSLAKVTKINSIVSNNALINNTIIFLMLYLFFYFINAIFPVQSDDLEAGLGGLNAAITSYMEWNGRIGDMLRVGYGSYFATTPFFPFINALIGVAFIFLFFVILFARLPNGNLFDSSFLFLITFILMIGGDFGAVFYWAAGSFNYLWAYFFIFLYLIPYRIFWNNIFLGIKNSESNSLLKTIYLFIIGLISGWSSELTIVLVVIHFAFIIIAFIKKVKLPLWYIFGITGLFIGFLILYFSPGTTRRANLYFKDSGIYKSIGDLIAMPFLEKVQRLMSTYSKIKVGFYITIAFGFSIYMKNKISNVFLNIFLTIFLIAILIATKNYINPFFILLFSSIFFITISFKYNDKLDSKTSLILGILILVYMIYIGATIQMPIPRRAQMHYTLLFIATLSLFIIYICSKYETLKRIYSFAIIFICIVCALFVSTACLNMSYKWERMVGYIEGQKDLGETKIIVSKDYFHSYYKNYGEWINPGEFPNAWPNILFEKHFGLEEFKVK